MLGLKMEEDMDYRYDKETGLFWWTRKAQGRQMDFPAGSVNGEGYVCLLWEGKKVQAHRLAWFLTYGYWPSVLDHINRKRDDNRIANLREVTHKQNQRNAGAHLDKKSKLPRSIDLSREGNFRVRVRVNGKEKSKQGFHTLEDAIAFRDKLLAQDGD